MLDLTLEDIREYTGQQGRKIGQEYVFMCPACFDEKGKDNLHFNEKKGILWCFANEQHNKDILSEIMKKKNERKKMEKTNEIPAYIKNQEKYLYYMELCNSALLGTLIKDWIDAVNEQDMFEDNEYNFYLDLINSDKAQKARAYLKEQRGINTSTISETGLGFDFKARKWVIPICTKDNIVGFEYRLADFKTKKIWREQGTQSCLAWVYGTGKKALIFEGFLDAYCALQMAKNKDDVTIFSTSQGVSSLTKVISQLQFNKYESITLILDNDEPADKVTKEIIEKFPFIKDGRGFLVASNCKDVNQYMLKKEV